MTIKDIPYFHSSARWRKLLVVMAGGKAVGRNTAKKVSKYARLYILSSLDLLIAHTLCLNKCSHEEKVDIFLKSIYTVWHIIRHFPIFLPFYFVVLSKLRTGTLEITGSSTWQTPTNDEPNRNPQKDKPYLTFISRTSIHDSIWWGVHLRGPH